MGTVNRSLPGLAGIVAVVGATALFGRAGAEPDPARPIVDTAMHGAAAGAPVRPADEIVVPAVLTGAAALGQMAFERSCATCHGKNAAGTDQGPPFVHKIYEPAHHGDIAFLRAARAGVQAHHWRFGDMPPVADVTDGQIEVIIRYVREVQRANGID